MITLHPAYTNQATNYVLQATTTNYEHELRQRLHDLLDTWEELADNEPDHARQLFIWDMIDQATDAIYPPEDAEEEPEEDSE